MHGLVNRALQCFLRDTFGQEAWQGIARQSELGFESYEAMLRYEPGVTECLIDSATKVLNRPREALLEDMGIYLVSHPNSEALRRLLRFGGATFVDFLLSLDDMPDRGRLALPNLELPELELTEISDDRFVLRCQSTVLGAGHVMIGLLCAMADDYGALVVLEDQGRDQDADMIGIQLLDQAYSKGKPFHLSQAISAQ
jgi:hypothetical protein